MTRASCRIHRNLVLGALAFVAACSNDTRLQEGRELGGYAALTHAYGPRAEFYSSFGGDPAYFPLATYDTIVSQDGCEKLADIEEPEIDYRDVGEFVTFARPSGTTLDAPRYLGSNTYLRDFWSDHLYEVASDWQVTSEDEGFSGSLRTPGVIEMTSPAIAVVGDPSEVEFPGDSPLRVTFSVTGADDVLLYMGWNHTEYLCRSSDDGELTVPASVIADLPFHGQFSLAAVSMNRTEFGRRAVVLQGLSSVDVTYHKIVAY